MKRNRSGWQSESTSVEVLWGWDAHETNLSVSPSLGSATTDGRSAVKHQEPQQCRNTHIFARRCGNWQTRSVAQKVLGWETQHAKLILENFSEWDKNTCIHISYQFPPRWGQPAASTPGRWPCTPTRKLPEPWSQLAVFSEVREAHREQNHSVATKAAMHPLHQSLQPTWAHPLSVLHEPIRNEQHSQGQMFPSVPLARSEVVRTLLQRFSAELKKIAILFLYMEMYTENSSEVYLKKLFKKTRVTMGSSNPTPGHVSGENSNSKRYMLPSVHRSTMNEWRICAVYIYLYMYVYIYIYTHTEQNITQPFICWRPLRLFPCLGNYK